MSSNYSGESFVLAEAFGFFSRSFTATVTDCPSRQLVSYEKNFAWAAYRGMNAELLGLLWLMANATFEEGDRLN